MLILGELATISPAETKEIFVLFYFGLLTIAW